MPRVVLALLLVPAALAQEAPRATVARAIEAHGGMARLSQPRSDLLSMRGHLSTPDALRPFTNVLMVQLPGQFKSV
ncbi:MAG: hypothetical protein K2W96_11580, partial [Gemmataceae bacterium]|nr:hypothetical protein [Gemmataceae bacterium]